MISTLSTSVSNPNYTTSPPPGSAFFIPYSIVSEVSWNHMSTCRRESLNQILNKQLITCRINYYTHLWFWTQLKKLKDNKTNFKISYLLTTGLWRISVRIKAFRSSSVQFIDPDKRKSYTHNNGKKSNKLMESIQGYKIISCVIKLLQPRDARVSCENLEVHDHTIYLSIYLSTSGFCKNLIRWSADRSIYLSIYQRVDFANSRVDHETHVSIFQTVHCAKICVNDLDIYLFIKQSILQKPALAT
jgi:hypothetical protein